MLNACTWIATNKRCTGKIKIVLQNDLLEEAELGALDLEFDMGTAGA